MLLDETLGPADEDCRNMKGRGVRLPLFVPLPPGPPPSRVCTGGPHPSSLTRARPGVRLIDINHQHSEVGLRTELEEAQSLSYEAWTTSERWSTRLKPLGAPVKPPCTATFSSRTCFRLAHWRPGIRGSPFPVADLRVQLREGLLVPGA